MGRPALDFDPDTLLARLPGAGPDRVLWVAYSGGPDSTALLLALHGLGDRLPFQLRAVHANHGVHAQADDWQASCAAVCAELGLPLHVVGPPARPLGKGSPEERLRVWRYERLAAMLGAGDLLCTAHHRDDQAETLLLALMRGSGPAGLAAMATVRPLGAGQLVRPLLEVPRAQLHAWLAAREVRWQDDPGNADVSADRNFLRHEVLPALRRRWPAADEALATSARLCREAADQLDAEADLALSGRAPAHGVLRLDGLVGMEPVLRTLLRRWLQSLDCPELPRKRLEELVRQLASTGTDRAVATAWAGHRLRHYRGALWLDGPEAAGAIGPVPWAGAPALALGPEAGVLALEARGDKEPPPGTTGSGQADLRREAQAVFDPPLSVRSRGPGDRFRAAPGQPSRCLKQWLSRSPLPPWLRDLVPVLEAAPGVVAVGDVVLDPEVEALLRSAGLALAWTPTDAGLAWAWRGCRASLLRLK